MTHNEKRTSWLKEGLIAQGVGVIYGVTVTAVGHVSNNRFKNSIQHSTVQIHLIFQPFDTIKTKMQAEKGYESKGMLQTCVKIFKTGGIKGFYRGCVPPLWGSGVYRSIQFSAFEASYVNINFKKDPDF